MDRKDFFRKSVFGIGAILLGTLKPGVIQPKKKILLAFTSIAGIQYYEGMKNLRSLEPGQELILKREPGNRYDPAAIEVCQAETKLGYIPRMDNATIALLMDQGVKVKGTIHKIFPDESPYHAVEIELFYEMKTEEV